MALITFIDKIELSGEIQSGEKYFSINLKGTKPNNTPRFLKKRTSSFSPYSGINHHKICVVSSIYEKNNLLLRITVLGRCTTEMLESSFVKK